MSVTIEDLKCGDIYAYRNYTVLVTTRDGSTEPCVTFIYRHGQALTECVPGKISKLLKMNPLHYVGNMTEQLGTFADTIQNKVSKL